MWRHTVSYKVQVELVKVCGTSGAFQRASIERVGESKGLFMLPLRMKLDAFVLNVVTVTAHIVPRWHICIDTDFTEY